MKEYSVTGMSCAACSSRVEQAVSKVPGVSSCSVSLLTNSMGVEGTATDREIISAVEKAGYVAAVKVPLSAISADVDQDFLKDSETPVLRRRLFVSLGFLVILLYFSMGHMMWNWPVPLFMKENHVMLGLLQLLLTGIIMVINQKFFVSGFRSLFHGAPNMDTLVALGATASFCYSTWMLFEMTDAQLRGDGDAVLKYMQEFYFESAAMILTLITVGKYLEARSKGRTKDALKSLMRLSPKTAVIIRDGKETEIPVAQVKTGDIFIIRPGENIPVDGIVLEGVSAVNEAALTGESIPVDKASGDSVSAATTNMSGFLRCEATRVGEDTTLSQIIRMVSEAAATKAPISKIADRVSGVFVPTVMGISLATFLVWLIVGQPVGTALTRAVAVLVISCPCSLGLATPVAIMVATGKGAKNGILFKNALSLEETGKVSVVALDKTGTITAGEPQVTDLAPSSGVSCKDLLTAAGTLEHKSEHPLAKAVLRACADRGIQTFQTEDFHVLPGNGLIALWNGKELRGGSLKYLSSAWKLDDDTRARAEAFSIQGKTPLLFSYGDKFLGIIAVADIIKEDSPLAVHELQNMGINVVMLTGDNQKTAEAIGIAAGVDEVIAGVLPDGKEAAIRSLQRSGKVAMVGDGINDAPALTRADVGIAIGAGADVAVDAADVVLVKNRLSDVPAAIRLSRATLRNIRENLFWAFFYNVIGIPLAAGVFISILNWQLNPAFGAAAMSLSSFCVVTNALRLNLFHLYDTKHDHRRNAKPLVLTRCLKQSNKEDVSMKKTMQINGMMCPHCEQRVKKTLEAIDGVTEAIPNHEKCNAVLTLSHDVDNAILKSAVEAEGYEVIGII